MDFSQRETGPSAERGQEAIESLDSVDALLRAAEKDERVEQIIQNFTTQLEDLPDKMKIDGGLTEQDQHLVQEFGSLVITALGEFGYETQQTVLDDYFATLLNE